MGKNVRMNPKLPISRNQSFQNYMVGKYKNGKPFIKFEIRNKFKMLSFCSV